MVFFVSNEASRVANRWKATAIAVKMEIRRRRDLKLPQLRGVGADARPGIDSHGQDIIIIVFSHKEMDEQKKEVIRGILSDASEGGFKNWLCTMLNVEHDWGGCRIKLSSREKKEEYHWSVERTTS